MHVKPKELGPVGGGGRRKLLYVDPPLDNERNLATQDQIHKCYPGQKKREI